ncbi:uncharacterized protein LOC126620057 [Malus sylvestris]|nr:uncharacterized protein LOC126620057 [Malus sylvestris]
MGREVSESCVDSLLTEMVSMYCNRLYANKPELAASRIDAIGYQVGHQLSERYTMERPRFTDHLDAIKFICKDFWSELFKKQIDNLKTNHRGTFVLQDNRFRWVSRMSLDPSENGDLSKENAEAAENKAAEEPNMHLHFSCGVIKGALHNLGIACAVSADTSLLPALNRHVEELQRNKKGEESRSKARKFVHWGNNQVMANSRLWPRCTLTVDNTSLKKKILVFR